MFEREIRYITDFTLNNIKKLGSFFSFAGLSQSRIHPAILQYISAELDYLIFLDRQRLLQKSLFDYSGAEVARHFSYIAAEIKKNKLIPFEDARRLVQQAVTYNVNFLLRPRWSLRQFVYDTEEYRTAEEIKLLSNYSYFYDYYKQFIGRYIERRSVQSLSLNEYSEKINVITQELLTSQFEAIISSSLDDTASFMTMGDANKTRLPVEMIEIFLKDRKLDYLINKVRLSFSADPKQKFEIDEYKKIILGDRDQLRIFDFDDMPEPDLTEPTVTLTEKAIAQASLEDSKKTLNLDINGLFAEMQTEQEDESVVPELNLEKEPVELSSEDYTDMLNDVLNGDTTRIMGFTLAQQPVKKPELPVVPEEETAQETIVPSTGENLYPALVVESDRESIEPEEEPANEEMETEIPVLNNLILEEIRSKLNKTTGAETESAEPDQESLPGESADKASVEAQAGDKDTLTPFEEEILSISLPDGFDDLFSGASGESDTLTIDLPDEFDSLRSSNDIEETGQPQAEPEPEVDLIPGTENLLPESDEHEDAGELDRSDREQQEGSVEGATGKSEKNEDAEFLFEIEDENTVPEFDAILNLTDELLSEAHPIQAEADIVVVELPDFDEEQLEDEILPGAQSFLAGAVEDSEVEVKPEIDLEEFFQKELENIPDEEPLIFATEEKTAVFFEGEINNARDVDIPDITTVEAIPEDAAVEEASEAAVVEETPVEPAAVVTSEDAAFEETPEDATVDELHAQIPEEPRGTEEEETETELFGYFTTKETMRIVGSVFRNDSIDFVNTIERIATSAGFDEANDILRSVFFAYKVDPVTDREAKMLLDRITMFFER
ncbi:MAG: hypothetical protein HYV28_07755 [Ignavibacteriales bacterium]|nr:hypothetical protein [Ignavibacteriales bacterium]